MMIGQFGFSAVSPPKPDKDIYIQSNRDLAEVMFEQLSYLIEHFSPKCLQGCEDCRRLEYIEAYLMVPFQSERRRR